MDNSSDSEFESLMAEHYKIMAMGVRRRKSEKKKAAYLQAQQQWREHRANWFRIAGIINRFN